VKVDTRSYIGPALCSQSLSTFSLNTFEEPCETFVVKLNALATLYLVEALLDEPSFFFSQRQQSQCLS
jgi:hypothetical protein